MSESNISIGYRTITKTSSTWHLQEVESPQSQIIITPWENTVRDIPPPHSLNFNPFCLLHTIGLIVRVYSLRHWIRNSNNHLLHGYFYVSFGIISFITFVDWLIQVFCSPPEQEQSRQYNANHRYANNATPYDWSLILLYRCFHIIPAERLMNEA